MKNNNIISITLFAALLFLLSSAVSVSAQDTSVVSIVGPDDWEGNAPTLRFVNQNPDPAEPGSYVEVRWKIENIGLEKSEDLVFEILPEYPFSLDEGANLIRELGEVDSYQVGEDAYIIYYKLKVDSNAVEGDNRIKLRYKAGDGHWITQTYHIRIEEHDFILGINEVKTTPENARPGDVAELKFELRNLASSDIKDVRVKVNVEKVDETQAAITRTDTPFAPIGSADEKVFKVIKANELKDITFDLAVSSDAESKVHKLPITVSYSDKQGTKYEKEFMVGVRVFDSPEYIFNLEDTTVLSGDQKGEVTFSISNIGMSEFKFLTVNLIGTDDYKVLSAPTIYVGNLASDDFETVNFDIYAETDKNEVPLKVELFYKDSYNKEYTDEIDTMLNLYSEDERMKYGFSTPANYTGLIIAVLVIAGIVFYAIYKRKKKRRSS